MLDIGINENLRFAPGAKISDKGDVNVKLARGKAFTSVIAMMEAETDEIPDESTLFLFLPKFKDKDGKKKDSMAIGTEIRRNYKYLSTMVGLYLTSEEMREDFSVSGMYKDLEITEDNEEVMFTTLSVVKKIFINLCDMLNTCVKKHKLSEHKEAMRLKMKRQSDDKAFPSLPYDPEKNMFVELMSSEPHKVKFTEWEVKNNWDNAEIITDVVEGTENGNVEDDVTDYKEEDFS